jgi:hypothetical protein
MSASQNVSFFICYKMVYRRHLALAGAVRICKKAMLLPVSDKLSTSIKMQDFNPLKIINSAMIINKLSGNVGYWEEP